MKISDMSPLDLTQVAQGLIIKLLKREITIQECELAMSIVIKESNRRVMSGKVEI